MILHSNKQGGLSGGCVVTVCAVMKCFLNSVIILVIIIIIIFIIVIVIIRYVFDES